MDKLSFLIFILIFIVLSPSAFAYRPFVSTDAAVVEKGGWEAELGFLSISHDKGVNEISAPGLRLNYGILDNWEVVGEFDARIYKEGEERDFELKDPALSLKGVLREGILQEKSGMSIAIELGILFPSTVKGESGTGLEGIVILTGEIDKLIYHLNLGGEFDREGFNPDGIWGLIVEYPCGNEFRLVGEVNGVAKYTGSPGNSGLIGFIWERDGFTFDFGGRIGLSDDASDWGLTTGITISF